MSDSDFVDVGDELVVSISGYPAGKVRVDTVADDAVVVRGLDNFGGEYKFLLPFNFKDYDTVDGYGHHSQPLTGVENG